MAQTVVDTQEDKITGHQQRLGEKGELSTTVNRCTPDKPYRVALC